MKQVCLLLAVYLAAVFETDPAAWNSGSGVVVCPLYLLACLMVWPSSPLTAAVWGAVIGLVADALSTGPLGIETVLMATLAWGAANLRCRHEWRSLIAFCLLSAVLVGSLSFGSRLLRSALMDGTNGSTDLLLSSLGAGFATAMCAIVLLVFGRGLNRVLPSFPKSPH